MQTQVRLLFILTCLLVTSCSPATIPQPTQTPSETPTSIPSPTETLTPTITPTPTITLTPEPTRTPVPNFPHKIVDGKIVFDWAADLSTFPDLNKGGSIPLTNNLISNWLTSLSSQGLVNPMPTADNICPVYIWSQSHTGGEKNLSQLIFFNSDQCTKENVPVRVLAATKAWINFKGANNEWLSYPMIIFAMQVYTPDDPKGYKLIPVVIDAQSDDARHISGFADPGNYLAINFLFKDSTLSAKNNYSVITAARFLESIGVYNQSKVDESAQKWIASGKPPDSIDGLVFVGSKGSIRLISP